MYEREERVSLVERCFFFFQAEDGIRDLIVTGVQTCALPICLGVGPRTYRSNSDTQVERDKRSEEHTSELQSRSDLVCRLLLEKKTRHQTRDLSLDAVPELRWVNVHRPGR